MKKKKKKKKKTFCDDRRHTYFSSFCVDNMRSVLESAVFETFQISTFILPSFKSI